MPKLEWSKEKVEVVEQLIVKGYTQQEIADHFGLTKSQIHHAIERHTDGCKKIRERHGLNPNPFVRNGDINWRDNGRIERLVEMINSGYSVKRMADEFNVSVRCVNSVIYKYTDGLRVLRYRAGLPLNIT